MWVPVQVLELVSDHLHFSLLWIRRRLKNTTVTERIKLEIQNWKKMEQSWRRGIKYENDGADEEDEREEATEYSLFLFFFFKKKFWDGIRMKRQNNLLVF